MEKARDGQRNTRGEEEEVEKVGEGQRKGRICVEKAGEGESKGKICGEE